MNFSLQLGSVYSLVAIPINLFILARLESPNEHNFRFFSRIKAGTRTHIPMKKISMRMNGFHKTMPNVMLRRMVLKFH